MTTPTTTYDALKEKQSELIRKALEGSIFVADSTAALPTQLTSGASSELVELPTGYTDVGRVDKGDGASWSPSSCRRRTSPTPETRNGPTATTRWATT